MASKRKTVGSRGAVNKNEDGSFDWKHCMQTEQWLITAGGKIRCQRCQAMSKRSRLQCGSPAVAGKHVCVIHGGRSTGPLTEAGRAKCAQIKTVHGQSTRQSRLELRVASRMIVRPFYKQMRVRSVPVFHGPHRGFALECRLG